MTTNGMFRDLPFLIIRYIGIYDNPIHNKGQNIYKLDPYVSEK